MSSRRGHNDGVDHFVVDGVTWRVQRADQYLHATADGKDLEFVKVARSGS